jgi:hypothetical protein
MFAIPRLLRKASGISVKRAREWRNIELVVSVDNARRRAPPTG